MTHSRRRTILISLTVIACTVSLIAMFTGAKALNPGLLLQGPSASLDGEIFWRLRAPRVILAFLAGSALALCGMVFQALFRNPLATPYTLGVASGASLGAVLYLNLGLVFSVSGISGLPISAFLGALLSISAVMGIARIRRNFSPGMMLLGGVALSFFFSSLILFLHYMSDFASSVRIMRWLMGGVDAVGMGPISQILPFLLPGMITILVLSRNLNLMSLGEEYAASRGVDTRRIYLLLFPATSLVVGSVVAICGPIGFIGMIAPHICRLIIGPDHRYLAPAAILFGGMFLVLCDLISRILIAPAEIPVGVITALIGGPFFIWLLCRGYAENRIGG